MPGIERLIATATNLAAIDNSNPDYNRALVELVAMFLPGDEDHVKQYLYPLIVGVKTPPSDVRRYTPAYEHREGHIVSIGSETAWLPGALAEAEALRSPEDMTEVFVAYRDVPAWRRLPDVDADGGGNDG